MLSKFGVLLITFCAVCIHIHPADKINEQTAPYRTYISINPYRKINDIPLPPGYKRINIRRGSFGEWLRSIDLKKDITVYKYDGTPKQYQHAQFAVLNIPVGKEDLQQCADAIIRLRAEYLYGIKRFDAIIFRDNNRTAYKFSPPFIRQNFDRYLKQVFGMCGSASLAKHLQTNIEMNFIQPGDVIIRGGFPGHAVIVMDVAVNNKGKKIYLLAQSYMPAQDIHVLKNPANRSVSPWYEVNDEMLIRTPEYTFTRNELKRW